MSKSKIISVTRILAMTVAATLSMNVMGEGRAVVSSGRTAPQLSQSYSWYDGNRQETVWLNPQVVAEFSPGKQSAASAKSVDANAKPLSAKYSKGSVRLWQMNNSGDVALRSLTTNNPVGKYSPVFHTSSNTSGSMRALPGNIIVYLNPTWDATTVANWIKSKKLEVIKKLEIGPNIYVIKTDPGMAALETANALYLSGEVSAAFPDWWQEVSNR
jgi:hypothetical protein